MEAALYKLLISEEQQVLPANAKVRDFVACCEELCFEARPGPAHWCGEGWVRGSGLLVRT